MYLGEWNPRLWGIAEVCDPEYLTAETFQTQQANREASSHFTTNLLLTLLKGKTQHGKPLSSLATAVWQSSSGVEGTDDQHFRCAYSHDARTWSTPLVMQLREQSVVWGPVLHLDGNILWLFFSESQVCRRVKPFNKPDAVTRWCPGGNLKYVQSENGVRWTKPVTILTQVQSDGVPNVLANQLVVLAAGRWLLPYW
eukprot:1176315-Prorocentrum_minimum.AAC.1